MRVTNNQVLRKFETVIESINNQLCEDTPSGVGGKYGNESRIIK